MRLASLLRPERRVAVPVPPLPDPVPFDVVQNFSSGSGALDTTKVAAGVHGANWGTWQVASGYTIDHTTIENHAVTLPFQLDVDGVLYDGSEGQGITFNHTGAPTDQDGIDLWLTASTYTNAQALALVRYDITGAGPQYNNDLLTFAGANYTIAQYRSGDSPDPLFNAHSEGWNGLKVGIANGTWLIVGLKHDSTNGIGEVFVQNASTLEVYGASRTTHLSDPAGDLVYFRCWDYLRYSGLTKEGAIKVKLIALREDIATFPPYAITVPAPVAVSCAQTGAGEITLSWTTTCDAHRVERRANGGAWGTVNNDLIGTSLVDTGLTTGVTYEYRVSARIGDQFSAGEDGFAPVEVTAWP